MVTAPITQTVGQPLTLICNATTVRGVISPVDIVWSRDSSSLRRVSNVSSTTVGSSLVYINSYTIPSLSVDDDKIEYECRLVVHAPVEIRVSDSVMIDVTGKAFFCFCL